MQTDKVLVSITPILKTNANGHRIEQATDSKCCLFKENETMKKLQPLIVVTNRRPKKYLWSLDPIQKVSKYQGTQRDWKQEN